MLHDRDVDVDALLREVGFVKIELLDPAYTISFEQELRFVEHALEYIPEAEASLELARRHHLHNYAVLGLALRACTNLSEVFDLIYNYPRLVWGICESSNHIDGDEIVFKFVAGNTPVEQFLLERDIASMKAISRGYS